MAQITIQATADIEDSIFDAQNPTVNYGTNTDLNVGEINSGTRVWRTIIQFDLSDIPAGSVVNSATLSLRAKSDASSNARTFRVYRVLRNWVVGEVTWNVYSSGNNWGTAGCGNTTTDREATDIGTRAFTATETLNEFKDFTLTASAVEEMLPGGTFTNNGFLIKADTETDDFYAFNSSNNGSEANNPKLVIDYTPPAGGMFFMSY